MVFHPRPIVESRSEHVQVSVDTAPITAIQVAQILRIKLLDLCNVDTTGNRYIICDVEYCHLRTVCIHNLTEVVLIEEVIKRLESSRKDICEVLFRSSLNSGHGDA